jgi:nitrogen fixation NifU-like protein
MTEAVKGMSARDAEAMFQAFRDMLAGGANAPGKLAAFSGVRAFPSRIKCANLAWHALHAALQDSADPVTTESAKDF